MSFLASWIVSALATAAAIWLVPGIAAVGGPLAGPIVAALVLAFVNSMVRPLVEMVSLPVNIVTLGLFSLVINALMLMLASWISTALLGVGIHVDGLLAALVGSLVISVVSTAFGMLMGQEALGAA